MDASTIRHEEGESATHRGIRARFLVRRSKTPACSSWAPANADTLPAHRRAGSGGGVSGRHRASAEQALT
jgi:hypothetical protein